MTGRGISGRPWAETSKALADIAKKKKAAVARDDEEDGSDEDDDDDDDEEEEELEEEELDGVLPGRKAAAARGRAPARQGLTLVHYSARLEPFLTQKHTRNTPTDPCHPLKIPETAPNCTPCHTEGA
jgi:hypothetical protein